MSDPHLLPDVPANAIAHANRFRQVSTRYPHMVAEAYGGDIDRAMADTDEQVTGTVAQWERDNGLQPRDWPAIGRAEGQDKADAIEQVTEVLHRIDQLKADYETHRAKYGAGHGSTDR